MKSYNIFFFILVFLYTTISCSDYNSNVEDIDVPMNTTRSVASYPQENPYNINVWYHIWGNLPIEGDCQGANTCAVKCVSLATNFHGYGGISEGDLILWYVQDYNLPSSKIMEIINEGTTLEDLAGIIETLHNRNILCYGYSPFQAEGYNMYQVLQSNVPIIGIRQNYSQYAHAVLIIGYKLENSDIPIYYNPYTGHYEADQWPANTYSTMIAID